MKVSELCPLDLQHYTGSRLLIYIRDIDVMRWLNKICVDFKKFFYNIPEQRKSMPFIAITYSSRGLPLYYYYYCC